MKISFYESKKKIVNGYVVGVTKSIKSNRNENEMPCKMKDEKRKVVI